MSNPRLLYISYLFPPVSTVGVHRTIRFLKWLPELGWEPFVLTPEHPRSPRFERELCDRVSPNLHVTRTTAFERFNYGKTEDPSQTPPNRLGRIGEIPKDLWRYLAIPDDKIGWIPYATAAGRELIRDYQIDAIFVSGKPFSSFRIGHKLSQEFQIPWIMDLRDLWTINRRIRPKSSVHHWLERRLERQLLNSASKVIANTPDNLREFQQAFPAVPADRFVTITNGYDQDDFDSGTAKYDKFTIAYTGTFYFQSEQRSSWYRRMLGTNGRRTELYDTHSPKYFFESIRMFLEANPELREKVEVKLAGTCTPEIKAFARESQIEDRVTFLGWLTHQQAMDHLRRSHLLCLTLARGEESAGWIPAKLFPYLGSGTPVLAMVPPGDCAGIVERTGAGFVVGPDDSIAASERIARCYRGFESDSPVTQPDWQEIEHYESRQQTQRLVEVLNQLCPNRSLEILSTPHA